MNCCVLHNNNQSKCTFCYQNGQDGCSTRRARGHLRAVQKYGEQIPEGSNNVLRHSMAAFRLGRKQAMRPVCSGRKKSMPLLVCFRSIRYRTSTLHLSTRSSLWGVIGKSNLEGGFALNMLSALIRSARSYSTMLLVEQLIHQRCVQPGPLVLGSATLKFPSVHSGYKPNCLTTF